MTETQGLIAGLLLLVALVPSQKPAAQRGGNQ